MRNGYQKEIQGNTQNGRNLGLFVRVERERRHSTNKYLLSAYYVPGTVYPPSDGKKKKQKTKTGQRQQRETEGEKRAAEES